MLKKVFALLALLLFAAVLYLLAWPLAIDPVAWTPPPPVKAEGIYAPNGLLKNIQRVAEGVGTGPEGIAVDALGRVYAGYQDGRLVMIAANGSNYQQLASTRRGRPLGITFGPNGGLIVADARRGLMFVGASDEFHLLVKTADQRPFALTNDVDNTRFDKNVYFTDSARFDFDHLNYELIEHRGTGRLLEYNFTSKQTRTLIDGLLLANGVAVGPDDAYVLVSETGASRIQRYWLKGEKAGSHDVFAADLPGLPDNISYDETHNLFWLALYSPRSSALEGLADKPAWLKKIVARLPTALQPQPPRKSWVLALDTDGKVVYSLDDESPDAYGPITSVKAWGPWLWFGSLSETSVGRLPLNQVIAGAPSPPSGWQTLPPTIKKITVAPSAEELRERKEQQERDKAGGKASKDDDEEDEEDEDRH